MESERKHDKIKLVEINSYLTCYLCKGYLIDATTISECLHSFCRSCIIKFLRENCYCPVCDVIINKAKPCLKLDKTLQDIVYKLVPELFVKEMTRRKQFYMEQPELMSKTTPEERGEDTERTIFNPQDAISLSIEYISDDSAPGAIRLPAAALTTTATAATDLKKAKNDNTQLDDAHQDNPMKRYLQCPGMCRIEVLKKFVRNKYNVDTSLFHIDILYKRVPLPDHYTLIDIGYIYSWKRNEPMKFFFRITDINKVSERFDYFDGKPVPEINITKIPPKTKTSSRISTKKNEAKHHNHHHHQSHKQKIKAEIKREQPSIVQPSRVPVEATLDGVINNIDEKDVNVKIKKEETTATAAVAAAPVVGAPAAVTNNNKKKKDVIVISEPKVENKNSDKNVDNKLPTTNKLDGQFESQQNSVKIVRKTNNNGSSDEIMKNSVLIKPEIAEEIKNQIQSGQHSMKNNQIYTNITLNRDDNVEIITKIQKVSNKDGHPIGLNIINHTVKKTNKVQNNKVPNRYHNNNSNSANNTVKVTNNNNNNNNNSKNNNGINNNNSVIMEKKTEQQQQQEDDLEKSNFLKSIELTAKKSLTSPTRPTTTISNTTPTTTILTKNNLISIPSMMTTTSCSSGGSSQKRKNSSPIKNEKKSKSDKKPVKIIIQPKTIQNPTVRQMVSNVNQNVNNLTKIVEQTTPKTSCTTTSTTTTTDIRSIIDNCKINIPSSLSITLNEGESNGRTPPSIPPVKNFIEILKLPDGGNGGGGGGGGNGNEKSTSKDLTIDKSDNSNSPVRNVAIPTFQKIFEESIKKSPEKSPSTQPVNTKSSKALDLTNITESSSSSGSGTKRKILEIASQLHKRSKLEMDKKENSGNSSNTTPPDKVAIPRNPKSSPSTTTTTLTTKTNLTSATIRSTSLGLNYTVSVNQSPPSTTNKMEVKKSVLLPKLLSPPPIKPPSSKRNSITPPSTSRQIKSKSLSPDISTSPRNYNNNTTTTKGLVNKGLSSPQNGKNLNSHQLLEKYNIQNLAQLTASFNFNAPAFVGSGGGGGGGGCNGGGGGGAAAAGGVGINANVALQHAMLLKHIEHQNWLNMNQGPLLQYEKYLQSLSQTQNKIVAGNIKEN